jgi:hypothetical protein
VRLQADEDADLRLLAIDDIRKLAHVPHAGAAAFDRDDGLLRRPGPGLEIDEPVDAAVHAFLLAVLGHGIHQRDRPPLELILVAGRQVARSAQVLRRAVSR